MENSVYWYDALIIFRRDSQHVLEAYFKSKEDAINFKKIMFEANPEIEVHINKWSWKVLVEK